MKKVLFVNCCIRREGSRTQKLADHFLEGLRKKEGYEIEELCLMDESLSYFTDGFFEQRERLLADKQFDHPRFRYASSVCGSGQDCHCCAFLGFELSCFIESIY